MKNITKAQLLALATAFEVIHPTPSMVRKIKNTDFEEATAEQLYDFSAYSEDHQSATAPKSTLRQRRFNVCVDPHGDGFLAGAETTVGDNRHGVTIHVCDSAFGVVFWEYLKGETKIISSFEVNPNRVNVLAPRDKPEFLAYLDTALAELSILDGFEFAKLCGQTLSYIRLGTSV